MGFDRAYIAFLYASIKNKRANMLHSVKLFKDELRITGLPAFHRV